MQQTVPLLAAVLLVALAASPSTRAATKPVRAFTLAGQSNMEGAGQIKADPKRNGGKGSLEFLVKDAATAENSARAFRPPSKTSEAQIPSLNAG